MKTHKKTDRRRHYLPAHLIGSFSADEETLPKRNRPIYVLRHSTDQPRSDFARNVGLKTGIYGYGKGPMFDHDSMFRSSEKGSGRAVDSLAAARPGELVAKDWVQLADYITSQITRGPDAEFELEKNIQKDGLDPARISMGYPMNYMRISSAVIRAEWEFVRCAEDTFILGDRGIAGFYDSDRKSYGYFVPLRKNFGVRLYKAPFEKLLDWRDGEWYINIPVQTITQTQADALNRLTYLSSRSEVYGPDADQLLQIREECIDMPEQAKTIAQNYDGAQYLGLSIQERMDDEMLLNSLRAGIVPPKFGEVLRRKV
jgi:hypothetical protein